MPKSKSIHTLNGRDNVTLEIMRDIFQLSPARMQREIREMRHKLEQVLAKKGVQYAELRSALVPDNVRREMALVFDTTEIKSSWYGLDVFERIIPLLSKEGNHSILSGDYLDRPGHGDSLFAAF
jgi:hypothetical protein